MSEETKTDLIRRIIEANEGELPSAYTNPALFAREAVAQGLVDGPIHSVKRMAQRVVERLRPKRIVVASDFHVPFHNKPLVENWLRFVEDAQPDVVVVNGDMLDCDSISRFASAPGGPSLQEEVDAGNEILSAIADAAPQAERHLTEGNHEERMQRFLLDNPGLYDLRCLRIPELLGLDELGFKWHKYGDPLDFGPLTVTHGHKVSKHSAYSAKRHLFDDGYDNVIHGHTHRLGSYFITGAKGTRRGFECGGLFDRKQADYVRGPKNWQNGFAVAEVFEGNVHVELIEATDSGMFIADGRVYR